MRSRPRACRRRRRRGLEAEPVELVVERLHAAAGAGAAAGLGAPRAAGVGGVIGVGADPLGQRGEQAGEQRVRGRVEAEARAPGGEEVEVLGAADGAAVDGLDLDQARLAQAVEVQPDGVGVEAEPIGELLGRQRRGRARPAPGTSRSGSRRPAP